MHKVDKDSKFVLALYFAFKILPAVGAILYYIWGIDYSFLVLLDKQV